MVATAHFIIYVSNQAASTHFYTQALCLPPCLDVPGITEFELNGGARQISLVAPLGPPRRLPPRSRQTPPRLRHTDH